MSTKTRRAAASLGVLAATSVAVSLAAAPAAHADGATEQIGPLVTETSPFNGAAAFSAPTSAGVGRPIPANRAGTLAAARAKAVRWSVPSAGATGQVRPLSDPELCVTAGSATVTNSSPVTLERCAPGSAAQRFTLARNDGSNNPIGSGLRSTYNGGFLGLYNTDDTMRLQSQTVADRIPNLGDFVGAFDARVDSVDVVGRRAVVSGTGTDGATVLVNGRNPVLVTDGRWSTTVSDLAIGTNSLTVEQFEGTQKTASTTVRADVSPAAIAFTIAFPADVQQRAVARGTAQPGAQVRLFDATGAQIGQPAVADDTTGAWTVDLPAPDAGGTRRVTAAQFLSGERDSAHDLTRDAAYGDAVAITAPGEGDAHAGGSVALRGTGEPGSSIEVVDLSDGGAVVGTSRDGVLPNRMWYVDTDALDRTEHVLRVVQHSKGANTTASEITLNPGETSRLEPARVLTPAEVTPGVENTFTGTGEPGASYRVLNDSGTVLVPGAHVVATDGGWTFDRVVSNGAPSFRFRIEQTKGGVTELSDLFVIDANSGLAPIVVEQPATVVPGVENTFTGTGPANATYQVLNASGTQIVIGTMRIDDAGHWSFDRLVSTGVRGFDFKLRVAVDGATFTSKLFTIPANTH